MIHLCRLSEIEEPTNIDPVDLRAIVDMDQCIRASFAQCGQPTHTNLSTKVRSRSGLSQNDSKTASDSQRLAWLAAPALIKIKVLSWRRTEAPG
jgi:hypothetical protein